MAYESADDLRKEYVAQYHKESYLQWLEDELIESNVFVRDYTQRRKQLCALMGLSATTSWDQAIETVKTLIAESEEYAWVRGEGSKVSRETHENDGKR